MSAWTLFLLSATALAAAALPLALALGARDTNRYRKLARVAMFLTFDLVVFGAFTRLTDSGLGCPDWPGCYGLANPFLAHEHIAAAEQLLPTGPVTMFKAWVEMIHRTFAMVIGVLAIWLLAWSWKQWRAAPQPRTPYAPGLPLAILGWICLTGAFGRWTVTLKLQPIVVTGHLMLGMGALALFTWLACRQDAPAVPRPVQPFRGLRVWALLAGLVVVAQVALGGWVSTNYATLACTEYPLCGGQVVPPMDVAHGFTLWRELGKTAAGHYLPFPALTAIHWVHRNFALVVFVIVGATAVRAWRVPPLRGLARALALLLAAQAATGISTIYLSSPLAIAVLHNAGAALLVLVLAMLNYRARYEAPAA
ncbi:MAG: COX15/CtaA family protein [Telluria sp.]